MWNAECDVCDNKCYSAACVTVHTLVSHNKMKIWMVAILFFCASLTYSDPMQPVHCSALNASKEDSPGCVSSTLLSPMPGKTIHIGGLPTLSTCMSACSAVHGEGTQALAVHRHKFCLEFIQTNYELEFFLNYLKTIVYLIINWVSYPCIHENPLPHPSNKYKPCFIQLDKA